ncbi:hypothetical protein ACQWHJ_24795, partial [Salmonella enterica subsp. enterica serovar Infantis]
MKDWYQTHPHLFHKRPYDRTGCDNYIVFGLSCNQIERYFPDLPTADDLRLVRSVWRFSGSI